jgi:CheY-like chemotaxis protein
MLFSSYRSKIDLLLTDITMPGMNGLELVERIRAIDPGVHILLMSGSVPEGIKIPSDLRVLRKPFLPQEMIQVVEQILESVPHRDFDNH